MGYTAKNRPSGNKFSPKRIAELERAAACLELRKRGKSFQEIADIVGFANRNAAYLAVQRGLQTILREPAEGVLELELQRLDSLLDGLWDQALGVPARVLTEPEVIDGQLIPAGTHISAVPAADKAVNAVLKIMERRAKLVGLDKPTEKKVDLTVTELPTAPSDMTDYNVKLLAALQLAGALQLDLPAGYDDLKSTKGLLLEANYTEEPAE